MRLVWLAYSLETDTYLDADRVFTADVENARVFDNAGHAANAARAHAFPGAVAGWPTDEKLTVALPVWLENVPESWLSSRRFPEGATLAALDWTWLPHRVCSTPPVW